MKARESFAWTCNFLKIAHISKFYFYKNMITPFATRINESIFAPSCLNHVLFLLLHMFFSIEFALYDKWLTMCQLRKKRKEYIYSLLLTYFFQGHLLLYCHYRKNFCLWKTIPWYNVPTIPTYLHANFSLIGLLMPVGERKDWFWWNVTGSEWMRETRMILKSFSKAITNFSHVGKS